MNRINIQYRRITRWENLTGCSNLLGMNDVGKNLSGLDSAGKNLTDLDRKILFIVLILFKMLTNN
jgi:hypothetical protein